MTGMGDYTAFCATFGDLVVEIWIDETSNPMQALAMVIEDGVLRPVHETAEQRAAWSGVTVADLHGQVERFFQLHKHLLVGKIEPCATRTDRESAYGRPWSPDVHS
jgi:hypothetical protein